MANPGRPERNRAARSFRQLRQFHHVINSDKVFGTHRFLSNLVAEKTMRFPIAGKLIPPGPKRVNGVRAVKYGKNFRRAVVCESARDPGADRHTKLTTEFPESGKSDRHDPEHERDLHDQTGNDRDSQGLQHSRALAKAKLNGRRARMAAIVVIAIGRTRFTAASTTLSTSFRFLRSR